MFSFFNDKKNVNENKSEFFLFNRLVIFWKCDNIKYSQIRGNWLLQVEM